MISINWEGSAPPAAVVRACQAHDLVLERGHRDANGVLVIHTATSSRVPTPGSRAAGWIWCCGRPASRAARQKALAHGAYDVICGETPDAIAALLARIRELLTPLPPVPEASTIITRSDASRRVVAQVARVAATSMSVLITGETGTGKEVMARLVHTWSPRQKKPFIPINCGAIPNELMEAELFGYARGAFSGAVQRYDGQVMAAEGGTVFLDEIDETPLEMQVKLLRVLEDHVVCRLGENVWHEVDFRLIAATNRDLHALIDAGLFGADLYERLAIVTIPLVPLRERLEDLPDLAQHFMARFAREQRRDLVTELRTDTRELLEAYPWPGNIRELRNVIYEALVYKRAGAVLLPSDLPKRVWSLTAATGKTPAADRGSVRQKVAAGTMNLRREVSALQRMAIEEALARTGGNAAQAARLLGDVGRGVSRDPGGTVRAMMRRLGHIG